MVIWKKKEAPVDAEQQRQEDLILRIHEAGGIEHMDKLELRDASEAITLCHLLNSSMGNGGIKCLENYILGLHTKGGE